jgi:mitochondrial fission protein ELM1
VSRRLLEARRRVVVSQPRIEPAERRIWVLVADKPGDNAQSLSLATAIGWPTDVKRLHYLPKPKRSLAARLIGTDAERFPIDRGRSSPLAPPWPDLVIGCGRRSVGVAWEIRRQAGPATRLVQLGRPRADLAGFDLVVTSPQYRLPHRSNVLHLALPLHRPDHEAWARAGAEWQARFAHLPRPWFAVLVGGSAKPFVLDVAAARYLTTEANALARAEGGSLLVSTSRRTPNDAAAALVAAIEVPAYVHQWALGGGPNPYLAYLGLADAFIVTGDSASMLTEACSTGKRVWYVALPERRSPKSGIKNFVRRLALAPTQHPALRDRWIARFAGRVHARGWVRYPRDLKKLHAALVAANRALPLGRAFATPPPPPVDETARAVAGVRALFAE